MKIGVQLYTLRDALDQDFEGTLAQVAQIGLKYVQVSSLHGRTPEQYMAVLKTNGLTPCGAHIGLDQVGTEEGIGLAKALGVKYVVVPWLSIDNFPGGWIEVADKLMEAGEAVAKHGLSLLYHNHAFEFDVKDGEYGYDLLWQHVDSKIVGAEIDLCWVHVGKHDPVDWLNRLSGSVPLTHFKDWDDATGKFADVGSGDLNWDAIIPAAEKAGVQFAIIEHDTPTDGLATVANGYNFLVGKGLS